MHTRAQGALMGPGADGRVAALREVLGQLLQFEQPLRHLLNLMYALDTCYDTRTADPHPLAGRWAPDIALTTPAGAPSIADLLHPARGVLLDLTEDGSFAGKGHGWEDRVDIITAHCAAPPAAALLIRPDGYVAWATAPDAPGNDGLRHALTTWFGTPAPLRKERGPLYEYRRQTRSARSASRSRRRAWRIHAPRLSRVRWASEVPGPGPGGLRGEPGLGAAADRILAGGLRLACGRGEAEWLPAVRH